jgi:hypothetical protein
MLKVFLDEGDHEKMGFDDAHDFKLNGELNLMQNILRRSSNLNKNNFNITK